MPSRRTGNYLAPLRRAANCGAEAGRSPHFKVARARGFDPVSTLTAMDIGIDVAVVYGTRGRQILCHDDLAPDYAVALARAYKLGPRLLQERSAAPQIRSSCDARRIVGGGRGTSLCY